MGPRSYSMLINVWTLIQKTSGGLSLSFHESFKKIQRAKVKKLPVMSPNAMSYYRNYKKLLAKLQMKRGAGGLGGSEALSRSARESAWGRRALYGSLVYGRCIPSPGPRES